MAEDSKPHCRIEMCGVAPIVNHATKNDTGKTAAWTRSTLHVRRGSHSPGWHAGCTNGVGPDIFTRAVSAQTAVRQAPDHSVLLAGRTAKRIPLEMAQRTLSQVLWLTTQSSSTARVLRTSVSVATPPQVSFRAAPPSQAHHSEGLWNSR